METYTCYDYENEINPLYFGPDANCNRQGGLIDFKSCSIDELEKMYTEYIGMLDDLRKNEPPKKRGEKDRYRFWVKRTHDLRDYLNEIAEELKNR